MAFKIGTYNSEAAIAVRDVSCTIERPLDTEDYTTNSSNLKSQPVLNGPAQISGSVTVDWTLADGKALQDLVVANTSNSVVMEWLAPPPLPAPITRRSASRCHQLRGMATFRALTGPTSCQTSLISRGATIPAATCQRSRT